MRWSILLSIVAGLDRYVRRIKLVRSAAIWDSCSPGSIARSAVAVHPSLPQPGP
jgi:hypothetical protein